MDVPQRSAWRDVNLDSYPSLQDKIEADVAIIGGGLTGIIAAYLLRNSGLKVVVLEGGTVGSVATALTTAFLMETVDTEVFTLASVFGTDVAQKVIASHRQAIDFIEQSTQVEGIDCDFRRCNAYQYGVSKEESALLAKEAEALRRVGVLATFKQDGELGIENKGYLEKNHQAKFHPLKYLTALTRTVSQSGVDIFEHTKVIELQKSNPAVLKTETGEVRAKHVLVATHYPAIAGKQPPQLFFKKAKYVSYVLEARIQKGLFSEGLYEDSNNPYHYFRVDRVENHDRLIIGGEDHRADLKVDPEKQFAALEEYLKQILQGKSYELLARWKGPIIESGDGLAYIGPVDAHEHIIYATGYSGNGMTYAVIAAQIFKDLVLQEPNAWQNIYSARRQAHFKPHITKVKEYIQEFIFSAVKNMFRF